MIPTEKDFKKLLADARDVFAAESNYIDLPTDKPIVIVGDTHGDYESTEHILANYKDHTKLFLGDYVDRPTKPNGSIINVEMLFKEKIANPDDTILLRGNHEFVDICMQYGFLRELNGVSYDAFETLEKAGKTFAQMPYIAATESLLALHGGISNIKSADELRNIPKGIDGLLESRIALQITWNDNVNDSTPMGTEGYFHNNKRTANTDTDILIYGEPFFSDMMRIVGKEVLVRGHDYNAKGYSLNDRALTLFTSEKYSKRGDMRGKLVAILDPQKEIKSAKDLKLEKI